MNNTFINKNLNLKSQKLDWNLVQTEMKNKLGLDIYESWLKKINFVEEFNNYILLSVPTRFIRDWITSRYLDQILQVIRNYNKQIIRVEFKIIDQDIKKDLKSDNTNTFDNNPRVISRYGGGVHTVAQTCDGIQLFVTSGNIDAGKFQLFGLVK